MNVRFVVALLAVAATLSATRAAAQEQEGQGDDEAPLRCLSMASIRSTRVIDDQTVLFVHGRGSVYLNRLERECIGLARHGKFTFEVHTGARHARLCATDSITVLERNGRGFNCGLGMFEPIETLEELELRSRAVTSAPVELPPNDADAAPAEPAAAPTDTAAPAGEPAPASPPP
jgi:hypothetical protein